MKGLLNILTILSADCPAQKAYLETIDPGGVGVGPDELALEYDDFYVGLKWRAAELGWPDEFKAQLDELSLLFDRMSVSSQDDLWTCEALNNNPVWEEVRHEAKMALQAYEKVEWSSEGGAK